MAITRERILTIRLLSTMIAGAVTALGEYYLKAARREPEANALLVVGIVAIVLIDPVIQLWRGKHVEHVLEELDRLEKRLMAKLTAQSTGAQVLQVREWNREYLDRTVHTANADESVKIWTTFFDDETYMQKLIGDLVGKGVKVFVLLMNELNVGLMDARFRLRKDYTPADAATRIGNAIKKLSDIKLEAERRSGTDPEFSGSLQYQRCDTMPFGSFIQVGDRLMLVGFFLPHCTWEDGPLVLYDHDSRQWPIFSKAWRECWDNPATSRSTASRG